jgi:hypothetical protein
MILGPSVAMLTSSAGVLLQCTLRVRRAQPLYRAAFSVASVAITVQMAGFVWDTLGGNPGGPTLVPLAATTLTYFVVNTALVATAIGVSNGLSPLRAWYWEFFWRHLLLLRCCRRRRRAHRIHEEPAAALGAGTAYVSVAYQMSLRRIDEERRHAASFRAVVTTQTALARAQQLQPRWGRKRAPALESPRLSVTVQTIRDGVMMVDRDGSILLMNDEARGLGSRADSPANDRSWPCSRPRLFRTLWDALRCRTAKRSTRQRRRAGWRHSARECPEHRRAMPKVKWRCGLGPARHHASLVRSRSRAAHLNRWACLEAWRTTSTTF